MINFLNNLLDEKKAKYLLVNSTNEFLTEFNDLEHNARYHLTGFKGSAGDVIYSKDKIWLLVDPRYHELAELQVKNENIEIVKLSLSQSFFEGVKSIIKDKNDKILINPKKISFNFFKLFSSYFENYEFLNNDPVLDFVKPQNIDTSLPLSFVPKYISGLSASQKINKLKKSLKSNEDALFISNLADIAYFTNLRNYSQDYSSSFFARMLVFKNKSAILFTDFKLPDKTDFNEALTVLKQDDYINFLNNCDYIKNILINKNSINLFDYNFLNINFDIKLDNFSSNLKAIKTNEEINHLKSAFNKTDKVMQKVQKFVNGEKNITEAQLFEFVEKEFKNEQSATNLSFSPIVGFGSNSSIIHYSVADENCTLKDGDFVLLDTGGYFEGGYATDITRTFCRNLPNEKQKEIYTFVLKAFLNVFFAKNVKNGYKLDKIARNILNEKKKEGFLFNHALGHGVGVNVHEMPPSISKSKFSKRKLKPNMVFTIEPGLYKEKCFGVRLENTVYTVKKGNKLKIKTLVKFPFEEKCIDFGLLSKDEKRLFRKYKRLTK